MPRPYRLGDREAGIRATRERILEAAAELYAEVGISAATMREIGLRADVAPGTLRNHFPARDDLDRALVERLAAEAPLPHATMFDGARSLEERLGRIIPAAGTFLDQARRLYRMWLREPMLTGPWLEKGAEYGGRWDQLMRMALGPLADDEEAMAVLRAVFEPAFWDAIRAGRRSTDEASALVGSIVVPWFRSRARTRGRLGGTSSTS